MFGIDFLCYFGWLKIDFVHLTFTARKMIGILYVKFWIVINKSMRDQNRSEFNLFFFYYHLFERPMWSPFQVGCLRHRVYAIRNLFLSSQVCKSQATRNGGRVRTFSLTVYGTCLTFMYWRNLFISQQTKSKMSLPDFYEDW